LRWLRDVCPGCGRCRASRHRRCFAEAPDPVRFGGAYNCSPHRGSSLSRAFNRSMSSPLLTRSYSTDKRSTLQHAPVRRQRSRNARGANSATADCGSDDRARNCVYSHTQLLSPVPAPVRLDTETYFGSRSRCCSALTQPRLGRWAPGSVARWRGTS
jgi:hypothetical protein